MKPLTSKIVIDYHKYMSKKFDFTLIDKRDSELMYLVGNGLEVMGVMDADKFMSRFAVTLVEPITDSKYVWIPWKPGAGNQASLIKQCEVLAHETHHTISGEDPRFGPKYLTSKSYRAHEEPQAMRPQMEVHFELTGRVPNTARLANSLKYYRVRRMDIRVAKIELDIMAAAIRRGGIGSVAGKTAIRYLRRRLR